jgi:hypothetical protein
MPADPLSILKTVYGYDTFRGRQREIIEHVIAGNHAFVLMPTGGGKSLCYQIPALALPGIGLVISPLTSSGGGPPTSSTILAASESPSHPPPNGVDHLAGRTHRASVCWCAATRHRPSRLT